jgi:hypothetical protein
LSISLSRATRPISHPKAVKANRAKVKVKVKARAKEAMEAKVAMEAKGAAKEATEVKRAAKEAMEAKEAAKEAMEAKGVTMEAMEDKEAAKEAMEAKGAAKEAMEAKEAAILATVRPVVKSTIVPTTLNKEVVDTVVPKLTAMKQSATRRTTALAKTRCTILRSHTSNRINTSMENLSTRTQSKMRIVTSMRVVPVVICLHRPWAALRLSRHSRNSLVVVEAAAAAVRRHS